MLYYNHSRGETKQCFMIGGQKRLREIPDADRDSGDRRPENNKEVLTMSINEMEAKARELRQLQALIDEATAEAEAIKNAIKAAMGDAESVQAGEYKITWKSVTSARLDTGALRKAMPDVAAAFTREATVRRFCVA